MAVVGNARAPWSCQAYGKFPETSEFGALEALLLFELQCYLPWVSKEPGELSDLRAAGLTPHTQRILMLWPPTSQVQHPHSVAT